MFKAACLLLFAVAALAAEPNSRHSPCGNFRWLWESFDRDCTSYGLYSFKTEDVDKVLTVATRENTPAQIPDSLLGLIYLDANPLADEVISMAGAECPEDDEENACYVKVFDERIWSWSDNFMGRLLYTGARQTALIYKFVFNKERNFARITPTSGARVEVPDYFAAFDMVETEDEFGGMWVRNSTLFGRENVYWARRIVDGEGQRTANWDKYYIANIGNPDRTLEATQQYAEKLE